MKRKLGNIQDLIREIERLKKSSVKALIEKRIREFEELRRKSSEEIFIELCFCILTANYNAEKSVMIQKNIQKGFLTLPQHDLEEKLRELGHRYPKTRAKYIVEARKYAKNIKSVISSFRNEASLREWLVKNIKGLGYKEASHFLRNIGYKNLAIIDFHIIDILAKYGIIQKQKTLTPRKYLQIEETLRTIAKETNLTLAELDLYLWYLETQKILK